MRSRNRLLSKEWLSVALVTLLMILLTAVPYILAVITNPPDQFFTAIFMNPEDSQTYFAKMIEGYNGAWLYTIPFTVEVHTPAFVGVYYIWLGHVARWLGVSLLFIWHAARVVAIAILSITIYLFIRNFIDDFRSRMIAYLLSLFGSGLGWVLFLSGNLYWLDAFPVDFKQPGAHIFFTALTYSHISLVTACLLAIALILFRLQTNPRYGWWLAIFAGILNLCLVLLYPFMIFLIGLIAVYYYLALCWSSRQILWRLGWQFFVVFLLPLPVVLYYAYTLQTNEIFSAWHNQSVILAAPWPHILLSYGIMVALAVLTWWRLPNQRQRTTILWCWIFAVITLLIIPSPPQRRFIQGVQVPLSIFSTIAMISIILPWMQQSGSWQKLIARPRYTSVKLTRFVLMFFLLFMSLSNIYLWFDVIRVVTITKPDPLIRPMDELTATDWLKDNGDLSLNVIGEYQTGNYVAAWAGNHVVTGHWTETVDYPRKEAEVAQFYDGQTSDEWRQALIEQYQIGYVWHGPREQELGDFDPTTAVYLQPIYENNTITIYKVDN